MTPRGGGGLFFLPRPSTSTIELGVKVCIVCESVGAEWSSGVNDVEEDDDGRGDGWQLERHRRE